MPSRKHTPTLAAVVLAAGDGKRMRSARPKVLHDVCGRPCLWHVLHAAVAARPTRLFVVVGKGWEEIEAVSASWGLKPRPAFVDQGEPLGTGHAVLAAEEATAGADDILVLAGDDPLIQAKHVRTLLRLHRRTKAAATILTTALDDPTGYARVIRDGDRLVDLVVEDRADASPKIRRIREVSTLVYAFRRADLYRALPRVSRENRQHEYYLPDVLPILLEKGERVSVASADLGAMGLNSRGGLAAVTGVMRARIVREHMEKGVTFADPSTAYVDVGVRIGRDTAIHPMTFLEGATRVGAACSIGPCARLVDTVVADGAEVTFSVVEGSRIGPKATVGPYARVRPGTVLEEGVKAGTFVEIKASRVGRGSKVPHLAYVGDARIGQDSNIGAGTVTVNYDGFEKHRTEIGDQVHIGSATMLVAPVKVRKRAWTGAGSVITKDVPEGALAVERSEQRIVVGYDRRKRDARSLAVASATRRARTKRDPSERGGRTRG